MVARRFGPDEEPELLRLYEAGWTQTRLAEHFTTSPITIRSSLRRAGADIRGPGAPPQPLSDGQVETIKHLYQQGQSQDAIARDMGTSQHKVGAVLRHAGIYSGRGDKHGQRHPLWKGGRVKSSGGYVYVKADRDDQLAQAMANESFYVLEHRLVMARSLGRPLTKHETVHHKNGDRADNRLENLQLRNGRHGNGTVYTCRSCGSHDVEAREL